MKHAVFLAFAVVLAGCNYSTQTRYSYDEVGQIQVVNFGSVIAVRDIDIVSDTSLAGTVAGGVGGGALGSKVGGGTGSVAGVVGGAVAGAIVGSALEQAIRNRGGVEYTVVLENGKALTVAQNVSAKDVILNVGDRVMVQINGKYQRVLPANHLPTEIEKPKGVILK